MNARKEMLYWMENESWYFIDRENDRFLLTEEAPDRAIRSFEMYRRANKMFDKEMPCDKFIGFYSEMHLFRDDGSVKGYMNEESYYNKKRVIRYLKAYKYYASCPRAAIDCYTKEVISPSFFIFSDGEYKWCNFLVHHIEKYNVTLPRGLIKKANNPFIYLKALIKTSGKKGCRF